MKEGWAGGGVYMKYIAHCRFDDEFVQACIASLPDLRRRQLSTASEDFIDTNERERETLIHTAS